MKSTSGDTTALPLAPRLSPFPSLPVLALALLLPLLLTAGCASKQEQAPATTQPINQDRRMKGSTSVPPPVQPQAATQSTPTPVEAGQRTSSTTERKTEAAPASASPAARMLQSAGRDASPAAQPEAGFTLAVPASIGDGEAFPVEFWAVGAQEVRFQWRGKTLTVPTPNPRTGTFQALLPVELDEKDKTMPLVMSVRWADGKNEQFTADLTVKKRRYPVQKLKVDSKYVSPPPEMEEKIKRDRAEMRAAVNKVTPRQHWTLPMLRPVPGEVTSLYGLRRVYNGVPKSPHKGLDLDAREGDPIHAADNGIVVLVSDHYYGGNTVVIDHGLGVLTAYLHLSAFNATVGQQVKRGDVIGAIGSTGRVTGPHLHLSLYVMGESVNIAPCLDM